LYDIRPGNRAGLFLQPWSPHGVTIINFTVHIFNRLDNSSASVPLLSDSWWLFSVDAQHWRRQTGQQRQTGQWTCVQGWTAGRGTENYYKTNTSVYKLTDLVIWTNLQILCTIMNNHRHHQGMEGTGHENVDSYIRTGNDRDPTDSTGM